MRITDDLPGDERLANRWGTFFIRFVWPFFGLGAIPAVLLSLIWERPSAPGLVLQLGGAPAMLAYWWFVSRPIRWVWAGPEGLRVSDGVHEVRLPYSEVACVRGFRWARDLVQVVLKNDSVVGRRFIFIPSFRLFPRGDHPVVQRMRERAALSGA